MESRVQFTTSLSKSKDSQGNTIINQYTLVKNIGQGGYAVVKLAKTPQANYVRYIKAVKIFKKEMLRRKREFVNSPQGTMIVRNALQDVYKEIDIIRGLNHPHIVKVHEIIDNEESEKMYLGKVLFSHGLL